MSISRATKYLDITKVSKDTSSVTEKYRQKTKVRHIKKIQTVISLIRNTTYMDSFPYYKGRMMYQYNVALSRNFSIVGYRFGDDIVTAENFAEPLMPWVYNGVLTAKYRVGSAVYRYALFGRQKNRETLQNHTDFTPYYNQTIGANCCFEFWLTETRLDNPTFDIYGNLEMEILASLHRNPVNAEELEDTVSGGPEFDVDALGVTLPETVPTVQPTIVWNDNTI